MPLEAAGDDRAINNRLQENAFNSLFIVYGHKKNKNTKDISI